MTTFIAKFISGSVISSTFWTAYFEFMSAFTTEFCTFTILELTLWAYHCVNALHLRVKQLVWCWNNVGWWYWITLLIALCQIWGIPHILWLGNRLDFADSWYITKRSMLGRRASPKGVARSTPQLDNSGRHCKYYRFPFAALNSFIKAWRWSSPVLGTIRLMPVVY